MQDRHRDALRRAGPTHPMVRRYLELRRNRPGAPPDGVAVEGLWPLRRALDGSVPVEVVFICHTLVRGAETDAVVGAAQAAGALALQVAENVLRRMVDRDGPDGVAAIVRLPRTHLPDLSVHDSTRVVVADGFELPGNLGTLIRGADGAGFDAVVLTDRRVRLRHPVVVRASTGTIFTTPVVEAGASEVLAWLRGHRFRIVAADPEATISYRDADYRRPIAIVLGNERDGLDPLWRTHADVVVSIPMRGVADSLNVAVAGALLMYEALHRA